jgi:NADPH:quinone reductase-like Zn-dependent oxidoreductase
MSTTNNPPTHQTKIIVREISPDFRKATKIVTTPLPGLKPHELLVQNYYLGINASDVNFTSGKYIPGMKVPFDCGFEGINVCF